MRSSLLAAAFLGAAAPLAAQTPPTPHPLGRIAHTAAEPFASIMSVRQLRDGRVLVNDVTRRRVLLLDADLAHFTIVADTSSATGNAYSGGSSNLIPYRGDSTLFVDAESMSMLVIDGKGKLGRVMSVPRPGEAGALATVGGGAPGFDGRGRLVYRPSPPPTFGKAPSGGGMAMPEFPDSAPIVRVNVATRAVDTVTFLKIQKLDIHVELNEDGKPRSIAPMLNPLPHVDDWVVTTDGRIAVLRGVDYHVDWFTPDGARTSSPKMPFDWQRLDDAMKIAYLDSTKAAMERTRKALEDLSSGDMTDSARALIDASPAAALAQIAMPTMGTGPMSDEPRRRSDVPARPMRGIRLPPLRFVEPDALPDYKPPFAAGGARADADGNIWVREIPTKPYPGPVYDVIDGRGALVDRVIIPAGTAIAGFGPGGIVYLGRRDDAGVHLMKAAVR